MLQAMDLISVAQKTGEVSADAYTEAYHQAQGMLPPPQMMGIEEMVERLHLADAESNPFASEGNVNTFHKAVDGAYSGAPSPGPGGQFRPPAIVPPAPSPPRSVVSSDLHALCSWLACLLLPAVTCNCPAAVATKWAPP